MDKNLEIQNLFEIRTKMILEKKNVSEINKLIENKEMEYVRYLTEDDGAASIGMGGNGVAYSNAAIGGMGAVVAAQPSNNTGTTIDPGYSSGGGLIGSGDISGGFKKEKVDNRKGNSKRRKNKMLANLKSAFSKKQDYTSGQSKVRTKKVMNFDDFSKNDMNTITRVTQ